MRESAPEASGSAPEGDEHPPQDMDPQRPSQGRNAAYLIANTGLGAATGILFWFLIVRVLGLPPADVGAGYSVIAMGTIVGVLAMGGLDTAVIRHVPTASGHDGFRLTGLAFAIATGVVAVLSLGAWAVLGRVGGFAAIGVEEWLLMGAIGTALVVTWLQDAFFIARGNALPSVHRNVVFSSMRVLLPFPIALIAIGSTVAWSWMLALVVSAGAAAVFMGRMRPVPGSTVPRRRFLQSAWRNIGGAAAQSLPGLALAPLVLLIQGPEAAAYFAIAWSAASLLFLASGAISRSALSELVRQGSSGQAHILRRAMHHHLWLILPGAVAAVILAPVAMGIFGADYAREGSTTLMLLAASAFFVSPSYLYLSVLRAQDRGRTLLVFPGAMILALALLAPVMTQAYGIDGMALAWIVANAPFGIYAAVRLGLIAKEVERRDPARPVGHPSHME